MKIMHFLCFSGVPPSIFKLYLCNHHQIGTNIFQLTYYEDTEGNVILFNILEYQQVERFFSAFYTTMTPIIKTRFGLIHDS